jgi:hypothetical protein
MARKSRLPSSALFLALLTPSLVSAQTPATVTFTVTTSPSGQEYDPRHVLAIWVTDTSNRFVKTVKKMAEAREQYLYTWRAASGGNEVDAITGATLSTHRTHTVTWDCTDASGATVPDGDYRIRVEFTAEHAQGPMTPVNYLQFSKGGAEEYSVRPADLTHFKDMSLTYRPDLETEVLIPRGSRWKYHDGGADLHATDWKLPEFDDAAWKEGPGPLGYGDNPATLIEYGPNSADRYPSYYFRKTFDLAYVPDTLKVFFLRDDGGAAYLNGVEAVRENLDPGAGYADLATATVSGTDETTYFPHLLSGSSLRVGRNVVSVEVHQVTASSSDVGFDLELRASPPTGLATGFRRGDADGSGSIEIADAVFALEYLFTGGPAPACFAATDSSDDGSIDVGDPILFLSSLFAGGGALPAPYPDCGPDPTPDSLGCAKPSICP